MPIIKLVFKKHIFQSEGNQNKQRGKPKVLKLVLASSSVTQLIAD